MPGRESEHQSPYELGQTFGVPAEDLVHSVKYGQEVVQQQQVEAKRSAYQGIAEVLGEMVPYLQAMEMPVLTHNGKRGRDILTGINIQLSLGSALQEALDDPDSKIDIAAILSDYAQTDRGGRVTQRTVMQRQDQEAENVQVTRIIQPGIGTAADVLSSFWRMLQTETRRRGLDFYEVALAPATLKTLGLITRAWTIKEVDDKLVHLGGTREPEASEAVTMSIMNAHIFDISEKGATVAPQYVDIFRSDRIAVRGICPAGRRVDVANEHGEIESVMPIEAYARIFLAKAQALEKTPE